MDSFSWAAFGAVSIALINMVGSVLLAWIKARYGVSETRNGESKPGYKP